MRYARNVPKDRFFLKQCWISEKMLRKYCDYIREWLFKYAKVPPPDSNLPFLKKKPYESKYCYLKAILGILSESV